MKLISALFLTQLLLLSANAQNQNPELELMKKEREVVNKVHDSILALNEVSLACTSASDCLSVPIGKRECGGPDKFIVVSGQNPYHQEVLSLVESYTSLDKAFGVRHMVASMCSLARDRGAACVEGLCQVPSR